jgi:hypothetical protein
LDLLADADDDDPVATRDEGPPLDLVRLLDRTD